MKIKEQQLLEDLLKESICDKCNTQMQFKPAPIYLLEEGVQDLIIEGA